MSELLISTILQEGVNEFVEVHFIGGYFIVGGHYLVCDASFAMNDVVENGVDGVLSYEIVAVDVILLAYAVSAVFALTAVGIGPGKFYKSHIRGCCERQPDTGSFDGADYELSLSGLKGVDGGLFLGGVVIAGDAHGVGELFLQCLDDFLQGAEDDKGLAVGEEVADKVGSLPDLSFGCEGAERHELDKSFHAHLATYFAVGTFGIFAEIVGEIGGGEVVFIAVGDFDIEVRALLVGQLCKYLCLLTAYHAGCVEFVGQFREVLVLAVLSEELAAATEVRDKTPHDGELRDEVAGMVHNWCAGEEYAPLLAFDYAAGEHGLLCGGVFEAVRLVHDYGAEDVDVATEYHIAEGESLAALDVSSGTILAVLGIPGTSSALLSLAQNVPDKELFQALVIDDGNVKHSHAEEVRPGGACGVVKDESFLVGELFKLPLPVYFQRGGADYEAGISGGGVDNADALEGLAESRLVTYEEATAVEAEEDTGLLVFVGFYAEFMMECCGHRARHQYWKANSRYLSRPRR